VEFCPEATTWDAIASSAPVHPRCCLHTIQAPSQQGNWHGLLWRKRTILTLGYNSRSYWRHSKYVGWYAKAEYGVRLPDAGVRTLPGRLWSTCRECGTRSREQRILREVEEGSHAWSKPLEHKARDQKRQISGSAECPDRDRLRCMFEEVAVPIAFGARG
jgi:hypothetical protein